MSDHFEEHYRVLGLAPGASWVELKAAYRAKISASHPDRIRGDAATKKRAEDQTKAINRAYEQLANYFRTHGTLPVFPQPVAPELPPEPMRFTDPPPAPPPAPTTAATSERLRHGGTGIVAAIGIAAVAYLFTRAPSGEPTVHDVSSSPTTPSVADDTPQNREPAADERLFTRGSTIDEVHSAQGAPTKADKDIWYYGTSKVYFANGVVVHWEQSPDQPLNVRRESPLVSNTAPEVFGPGSSKADVRRIQGHPIREHDKVWEYGVSRIYFEHDKVVSWYESPLDPLKVKR